MSRFVWLWNFHRIRGPCKGIPEELAKNSPIEPIAEKDLPQINDLVSEYNLNGGRINADLDDAKAFQEETSNAKFNEYLDSVDFETVYDSIVAGNSTIILD